MSLVFNMLSRLVITFLPRSKHLLVLWLQSPSTVILEPPKIKSATVFIVSPSVFHELMGSDAMILVFWMFGFKPTFSLFSFTFIKRLFSSSSLSAMGWCHQHIWGYWYFSQQSWLQLVLLVIFFLQFKSEFCNKEFMIWATVSPWYCFRWLYRASSSLAANNIINLLLLLTIWWCPCAESSLVLLEEGVCYDQCVLLANLY